MVEATDVSLGGETAKALVAKFTLAASGFVATILFARELGPTAFGGYYLLFALTKIADRPLNGWASASKNGSLKRQNNGKKWLVLSGVLPSYGFYS
ncbi:hypothetical protein ACFFQF_14640 [Haladaptatus pallidirubidus]|uniref:hypothetical protein n=1 Tax=Haladaptatus pallidirubidus TaxID=1008152 RepID=UPI0035ECB547